MVVPLPGAIAPLNHTQATAVEPQMYQTLKNETIPNQHEFMQQISEKAPEIFDKEKYRGEPAALFSPSDATVMNQRDQAMAIQGEKKLGIDRSD